MVIHTGTVKDMSLKDYDDKISEHLSRNKIWDRTFMNCSAFLNQKSKNYVNDSSDPKTRISEPETRISDPESRISDPEIRISDPEIRLSDPEISDPDAQISSNDVLDKFDKINGQGTDIEESTMDDDDHIHHGYIRSTAQNVISLISPLKYLNLSPNFHHNEWNDKIDINQIKHGSNLDVLFKNESIMDSDLDNINEDNIHSDPLDMSRNSVSNRTHPDTEKDDTNISDDLSDKNYTVPLASSASSSAGIFFSSYSTAKTDTIIFIKRKNIYLHLS
jgi:hypothetical protein